MKRFCTCFLLVLCCAYSTSKADTKITSPNGQITVSLQTGSDGLGWTVSRGGKVVYTESGVSLSIGDKVLGGTAKVKNIKQRSATEKICTSWWQRPAC